MKEIGGYIELDEYTGSPYHTTGVELNCARNGFAYLIEARKISKVYIPYYLCESIQRVCQKYQLEYEFYHVDQELKPIFDKKLKQREYLFLVNYFGQFSNEYFIQKKKEFGNIIVDNSQAFFQHSIEKVDTIYSCRKFLGVTDGAYLMTTSNPARQYEQDVSFDRMNFLLGRYERNATQFYQEYCNNNDRFFNEPIKYMSKLTQNLLRGIDYIKVKERRTQNYNTLYDLLESYNRLKLKRIQGAFAYPFWVENGEEIRKALVEKKIYIPMLWPGVVRECNEEYLEVKLTKNLLPIPCDQRYSSKDMEYIWNEIKTYL